MRSLRFALLATPVLAFTVGCSSTPAVLGASVDITSPDDGAAVTVDGDKKLVVNFSTNYTLKPSGMCNGQKDCGSIYMLIDNTNCDDSDKPYNTLAVSSPVTIDFSLCNTVTGQHKITAELHSDSGSIVDNNANQPISSTVTVTVQPSS